MRCPIGFTKSGYLYRDSSSSATIIIPVSQTKLSAHLWLFLLSTSTSSLHCWNSSPIFPVFFFPKPQPPFSPTWTTAEAWPSLSRQTLSHPISILEPDWSFGKASQNIPLPRFNTLQSRQGSRPHHSGEPKLLTKARKALLSSLASSLWACTLWYLAPHFI